MEKRKYPRIPKKMKFFYKADYTDQKNWLFGWINNLSLGGAFAKLSTPLPVGSRISLRLPLEFMARGTTVCNLSAQVVRIDETKGDAVMGITFLHGAVGSESEKVTLAKYVREQNDSRQVGKNKMKVKSGAHSSEKKLRAAMQEAVADVDGKKKRRKGFISKIFDKS